MPGRLWNLHDNGACQSEDQLPKFVNTAVGFHNNIVPSCERELKYNKKYYACQVFFLYFPPV